MGKKYSLGVDFGSLSARAVLYDVQNGQYIECHESLYEHGIIEKRHHITGDLMPVASAMQIPADFVQALGESIKGVIRKTGVNPDDIIGMSVDATSCSLMAVDKEYRPMCMHDEYNASRHSYVKMWKQHTAAAEAEQITVNLGDEGERFGGRIFSEWGIPKILETLHEEPKLYEDTYRFMEMGDWIIYKLTGQESMSYCSAGLKFMWTPEKGYPSPDFFANIDPDLRDIESKLIPNNHIYPLDTCVGTITKEGAELTGLIVGTPVAPMRIDGHSSVVAVGCDKPGSMDMILGTSMGLLLQGTEYHPFPGVSGVCYGSMVPGLYGYETGLTGCGDIFQWFIDDCVPERVEREAEEKGLNIFAYLTEQMKQHQVGESGLLALDWWNGNRSILTDDKLTGLIVGLTLNTRPYEILRALFEATGFGARRIVEEYVKNGIAVNEVVAVGGIAERNPFLIQMYADILGCPIHVPAVKQACARGTAIYAAVAAGSARGGYDTLDEAIGAMAAHRSVSYMPNAENHEAYNRLYENYKLLHDTFRKGGIDVMRDLLTLKDNVRKNG